MRVLAFRRGKYAGKVWRAGEFFEIKAADLPKVKDWVFAASSRGRRPRTGRSRRTGNPVAWIARNLSKLSGEDAVDAHRFLMALMASHLRGEGLLEPDEIDTPAKLAAYVRALALYQAMYRDFQNDEFVRKHRAIPPDTRANDYSAYCQLIGDLVDRVGLTAAPSVPVPPVSFERHLIYYERVASAAEEACSPAEREALAQQFESAPERVRGPGAGAVRSAPEPRRRVADLDGLPGQAKLFYDRALDKITAGETEWSAADLDATSGSARTMVRLLVDRGLFARVKATAPRRGFLYRLPQG